ncbi:MAG: hypothetical protein D6820_17155 [Lentisphaerae bacterium]|nr:MAG: hypothetical protein D6820_17155 [Lentisphaerota bacterium]
MGKDKFNEDDIPILPEHDGKDDECDLGEKTHQLGEEDLRKLKQQAESEEMGETTVFQAVDPALVTIAKTKKDLSPEELDKILQEVREVQGPVTDRLPSEAGDDGEEDAPPPPPPGLFSGKKAAAPVEEVCDKPASEETDDDGSTVIMPAISQEILRALHKQKDQDET